MIGEWCFFKSALSDELCDQIIKLGMTLPSQSAKMGVDTKKPLVDDKYRRSNIRFIQKPDIRFQFLFDLVWKYVLIANDDFFHFHITKLDYIQLAEYDGNERGEYKKHHDVFWINNDPKYHRKLSMVIQLSDPNDYKGGDLELYDLCLSAPPKDDLKQRGSVIIFPSFITHAALPVTEGKRYSLAVWFDGPKWR